MQNTRRSVQLFVLSVDIVTNPARGNQKNALTQAMLGVGESPNRFVNVRGAKMQEVILTFGCRQLAMRWIASWRLRASPTMEMTSWQRTSSNRGGQGPSLHCGGGILQRSNRGQRREERIFSAVKDCKCLLRNWKMWTPLLTPVVVPSGAKRRVKWSGRSPSRFRAWKCASEWK